MKVRPLQWLEKRTLPQLPFLVVNYSHSINKQNIYKSFTEYSTISSSSFFLIWEARGRLNVRDWHWTRNKRWLQSLPLSLVTIMNRYECLLFWMLF